MCDTDFGTLDVPSYGEFLLMDRPENDPEDVSEVLNICEEDESHADSE